MAASPEDFSAVIKENRQLHSRIKRLRQELESLRNQKTKNQQDKRTKQ